MRRSIESGQYSFAAVTSRLVEAGVDPSVGSVDDNALAGSTVGSFKTELIRRQGPWRGIDQVEIETLNWAHWFNTGRPHECLDDLTPRTPRSFTPLTEKHWHRLGDSGEPVLGHVGRPHAGRPPRPNSPRIRSWHDMTGSKTAVTREWGGGVGRQRHRRLVGAKRRP